MKSKQINAPVGKKGASTPRTDRPSSAKRQSKPRSKNGKPAANNFRNPSKERRPSAKEYGKPRGKLKVIFLGGVGEIGKNMTAFEYGDSIVVIDAGMSFPGSDMPGEKTA